MLNFWEGHKTQIIAGVGILTSFALSMGWIDERLAVALASALGFGGLSTVRHALAKQEAKVVGVSQQVASAAQDAAIISSQVAEVKEKVAEVATTVVAPEGRIIQP